MGLTLLNLGPARIRNLESGIRDSSGLITLGLSSPARLREAAAPLIFYGSPADFEGGFRRISQPTSPWRDLLPPMQWNMQRVAYYLYVTNPLARRIVEMLKDFVVGEGVTVTAKDPAVQSVLDDFWNDPVNRMDQNLESFVKECSIFGEQCWYVATNPVSGKVRLGYIDPYWIDGVEYATLQGLPGKAMAMAAAVILKTGPTEPEQTRLEVIHPDEDPGSPTHGLLIGNCFYWAINKARSGHRGLSDLFALADWLDGYDQMLYSLMNQMDSLSRFIWDVTLTGMTGEQIREWLKDNGAPPRPNSIRAHNEKVTWAAVVPSLQATDRSEGARLVKDMAIAGSGYPGHWFDIGDRTNKATALAQGEPTLKMLTSRQRQLKYMLNQLLEYVVDRGIASGTLPDHVDRRFQTRFPDLSVSDQSALAAALQSVANGMVSFQNAGAADTRTLTDVLVQFLKQLGIEADPSELLARAQAEKQVVTAQDDASANSFANPSRNRQGPPSPGALGSLKGRRQGADTPPGIEQPPQSDAAIFGKLAEPSRDAGTKLEVEGPPGSIGMPGSAGRDGGHEDGLNTAGPANTL